MSDVGDSHCIHSRANTHNENHHDDTLLDGSQVPWDFISGPKPPSAVSAHRLPPNATRATTDETTAATQANLRVLQRAMQSSTRWAGRHNRNTEQGEVA